MARREWKSASSHPIVQVSGCVVQRLADVFLVQFGILAKQFGALWVQGNQFEYASHGQAQVAYTGLAVHACRVNSNAIPCHRLCSFAAETT
jgi:hypothetical protein